MNQVLKKDWEIARIFFILAILTLGFVLVLQSLVLTPTTGPQNADSAKGPSLETATLGKLGIYPEALFNLKPSTSRIPLRASEKNE